MAWCLPRLCGNRTERPCWVRKASRVTQMDGAGEYAWSTLHLSLPSTRVQALYFDIRKGAHSIGSNVRDATAYVLWALARTQDHSALASYSETLSRHLVTVALYDREIHIRRAASAAFQEHVGRTVSTHCFHLSITYDLKSSRVCSPMA